jgi:hypothetical protein
VNHRSSVDQRVSPGVSPGGFGDYKPDQSDRPNVGLIGIISFVAKTQGSFSGIVG